MNEKHNIINKCSACVYKNEKEKYAVCPECNRETLHWTEYGSACLCSNCGYGFARTPDFPPCFYDSNKYIVSVTKASKDAYVQLAKVMACGVVRLKRSFDEGTSIDKEVNLREARIIIKKLNDLGVEYTIIPNLIEIYKDIETCEENMFN